MDICEINFNKDINEHYNPGHHKGVTNLRDKKLKVF